jgi:molybdopterin-guanine dinucleotide biosynthesis protein A
VLAGGRSVRFGPDDKLAATVDGIPLLHHAVLRLAEVTGEVVVVLAPGDSEPPMPSGAPVRFARDARPGEGPLAGAVAGLAMVERGWAVLAGGDMPTLSIPVLREMVRVATEVPADAVALRRGDRVPPLPVVVRVGPAREAGRRLLRDGERSLSAWLRELRPAEIDERAWTALDPGRETLRDIDERSDLDHG